MFVIVTFYNKCCIIYMKRECDGGKAIIMAQEELKMEENNIDVVIETSEPKKTYTEDEVKKMLQAETDRRVEKGIQKGLETQKEKWKLELEERAKMSAEELAKKEYEDKLSELSAKEVAIRKKANEIEAKDMFVNAGVPKSHYEKFIKLLVTDDLDATIINVNNFISVFNETKNDIETTIKSKFTDVKKPETGKITGTVTKEDFKKMSYSEKIALKTSNPELYKELLK